MDVDGAAKITPAGESRNAQKRRKENKSARVEKHRHRKAKNGISFPKKVQRPKK